MRILWMSAFAAALAGCAQQPTEIFALDGSRSDGMVTVALQGTNPITVADMNKALTISSQRCAAWGYQGAEKFGSKFDRCTSSSSFGCTSSETVVRFQCIGNPDAGGPKLSSASSWSSAQTKSESVRDEQIQRLMQSNLPYEEYQARYRKIMGE